MFKKRYFLLLLLFLLLLYIINFNSQTKNIMVSQNWFDFIENTDFTSDKDLINMGFELYPNGTYSFSDSDFSDPDEEFMLSIYITSDFDRVGKLKKHDNILYNAEETRVGIFSPKRLFDKNLPVTRRCRFYKDSISITIVEDNVEKK